MAKVIIRKHPMNTTIDVGDKLTLTTKTLSGNAPNIVWEADLGKGWKEVGKGKAYTVNKAKELHSGNYRCVINNMCSRIARVTVVNNTVTENELPTPTKENDVFIEILEATGKDASQEIQIKASKAMKKLMPKALKG